MRAKIQLLSLLFVSLSIISFGQNKNDKNQELSKKYRYQMQSGKVRLEKTYFSLGKVSNTETKTDTTELINTSDKTIELSFSKTPAFIKIKAVPSKVKPNKTAKIIVEYKASENKDGKGRQRWGYQTQRVNLIIDGDLQSSRRNYLTVRANIYEDFSHLTEKELAQAPVIQFEEMSYDFGKIKQGDVVKHDFVFKNTGKNPLEIRRVKGS